MTEAVGRARFGNSGGGHRLLESSGVPSELLTEIRWHTDLPPRASTTWAPFFAGYQKDDYYIVQRTSPDFDAERSGMVETGVVVHPVAGLGDVSLAELKMPVRASTSYVESVDRDPMPHGVGPCIDLLSSGSAVHWIGQASFDRVVEDLWDLMGPTDRSNLVFGLLFSPTSIPYPCGDGSIEIYLVPDDLRSRFEDATIIDAQRPPASGATARTVLSGDTTLAEQLSIARPSLNQWRMLAVVQNYLDRIESLDPDEVRSCAHLLGALTAVADDGLDAKERIGARLKAISPNASFAHILGCRNLPFHQFPGLTLLDIVGLWATEAFSDPNRLTGLGTAIASLETGASEEFENALGSSLRAACLAVANNVIEHLHAAIVLGDQRSFSWLIDTTQSSMIDGSLAATVGPDSAAWLHAEAHRHVLPETHAAACPNDDPIAAWEAHLAIDGHTTESRGRLASRCEPKQLVEAALRLGDRYLVEFAGAAAMAIPEALGPARPADRHWRAVLASATGQGADPWTWVETGDVVEPVLRAFLDGETNLMPLVAALSSNDAVDVLDFSRRSQVWTSVGEPLRTPLLLRTALVATMRGDASTAMESPLLEAICSSANLRAAATRDVSRAIDTLEALAQSCTAESAVAIATTATLDGDSQRFGRIVATNSWTEVARFLAAHATRRSDLRPAADECRHLLTGWERFKLTLSAGVHPTSKEFSDGLLDVATTLYPSGPHGNGLWERSGGHPADVLTSGTGRDQWTRAIQAIVEGATGAPSMRDLLDAMIGDYKRNKRLKKLRGVL